MCCLTRGLPDWIWWETTFRIFSAICPYSVQFSHSVVLDSLQPHESQHSRPPCPSPTPGVHSNSSPSILWCHPAISSSVVPFSSFLQSLPASESFPMSQLFAWGGQSTGVSALVWLSQFCFKKTYLVFVLKVPSHFIYYNLTLAIWMWTWGCVFYHNSYC